MVPAASEYLAKQESERSAILEVQAFQIGDRVKEVSGTRFGAVTSVYVLDRRYRYVIQGENGSEFVCFEKELIPA